MASRRSRDKDSVGNKLNSLTDKVSRAERSTSIGTNEVKEENLAPNAVSSDALQTNSVTSDAIDRGAVGTENLGIVSKINSDASLTLSVPSGSAIVLEGYERPTAPLLYPISLDYQGKLVIAASTAPKPYVGYVNEDYSSGNASVFIQETFQTVSARVPDDVRLSTSIARKYVTLVVVDGQYWVTGVYSDIATGAQPAPQRIRLTGQNGWQRYEPPGSVLISGQAFSPIAASKSAYGLVVCQGIFGGGTGTAGTVITTLPEGMRPPQPVYCAAIGTGNTYTGLRIGTDGAVSIMSAITGGANSFISLGNVVFNVNPGTLLPTSSTANGWTNTTAPQVYYGIDPDGGVWMRGALYNGTTTSSTKMADLPAGTAPAANYPIHAPAVSTSGTFAGFGVQAGAEQLAIKGLASGNGVSVTGVWGSSTYGWNPVYPAYQNGWLDYNTASFPRTQVSLRNDGLVLLRGFVRTGTLGTAIFTLPDFARPAWRILRAGIANGAANRLDINSDGTVVVTGGSNTWLSLDGVIFNPSPVTNPIDMYWST